MIKGRVVVENEVYKITDALLVHDGKVRYTVSETRLNPREATRGHSHADQDEVYIFTKGSGRMVMDEDNFAVSEGDSVYVPAGVFHKVINESDIPLTFLAIFQGATKRPK